MRPSRARSDIVAACGLGAAAGALVSAAARSLPFDSTYRPAGPWPDAALAGLTCAAALLAGGGVLPARWRVFAWALAPGVAAGAIGRWSEALLVTTVGLYGAFRSQSDASETGGSLPALLQGLFPAVALFAFLAFR